MFVFNIILLFAGFSFVEMNHLQKFEVLTDIFFKNLQNNPKISVEKSLSEDSKLFIDEQISNFVRTLTGETPINNKRKRSLLDKFTKNEQGIYLLNGVKPSATIPVRFPQDIALFEQNFQWFAAALESPNVKENANYLVIYSYENETFTEKARISISNGVRLSAISLSNFSLIAVAENDKPKENFHNKSGIYQFDGFSLVKIQSIDMHYARDIVLWRIDNEIYMSIAQFMSIKHEIIHYETEIPIYKWLGKHFDLVQKIKGKGTTKITPFKIDEEYFLAVANFQDDDGNKKIYSNIYKYNYHFEKYELYQNIWTRACLDIEIFTLRSGKFKKDIFLIVANSQEQDSDGDINYETDSILYKFNNDYFIPFQTFQLKAVENWLPINGPNNEFILFASCQFDGIKSFQYDGWAFTEVFQNLPQLLKKSGIKSIRAGFNHTSLVVANKYNNGKIANIFEINFCHKRFLNEIYDEMFSWCDRGLQKIEDFSNGKLFDDVLGKPERADIDEEEENTRFELIQRKIDHLSSVLDRFNTTPQTITTEEIFFNNITFIYNLNVTKLNEIEANAIFENILDIDEGFEMNKVDFSSIEIENIVTPKFINGHESHTLVHTFDELIVDNLKINGTLIVPEPISLGGKLNGMIVDNNLLQKTGDQNFSHPLRAKTITVDKITAKSFNNQNLSTIDRLNRESIMDHIETLTVRNLTIGGYINDVDIPTLDKYALKKTGDQVITSTYVFDVLQGANLEVFGRLSGRKLSELIPIDGGNYTINQDIIFKNDVFIDNLQISDSLNGIEVDDGQLDILLKDSLKEQEITGDKIFEDVVIYHAISLQGHINSKDLEKMNPVFATNDNLFLEGDKTITGQVLVEEIINAEDIITPGGNYSLAKLQAEGLRLDAKNIHPHLYFVQQINVDEIFVDTINGKNPNDFVVLGTEEPQIIESLKIFSGDLHITGDTTAHKINNVDVEELETQVLKVNGDQIIVGKHHVKHVVADKIVSNSTHIDNSVEDDVSKNLTFVDLDVEFIKTKNLFVKGLVNNLPFDKIINDTVMKNSDLVIKGVKHFKNLIVDNLNVENGFEKITDLRVEGPLNIENIKIENIYFKNKCNGVDRDYFDEYNKKNSTVIDDQEFENITVYGKVYISSNWLGHVNLEDLVNNSVKINEPFHFDSATFESDVISNKVNLYGDIENLDFDNILLSKDSNPTIFSEKIFNNLTINGTVEFQSLVNGLNITEFCQFCQGEIKEKNLTIHGNAVFSKGPKIVKINNVDAKKIKDGAWFKNQDAVLTGSVEFEDVIFKNNVEVGGFVDNTSLTLLYQNYLSKSKNQNVTATFNFQNNLIFENLTVPKITMDAANINEINLEEFVRTALLDNYDQVFEIPVFFENCSITNLTGDFKVNGLDLSNDVMRYDKINMVSGAKIFQNLNVDHLKLEKNVKIQNVDILNWFKNSVLKTTTFNITKKAIFNNNVVFTNGFEIVGNLNGLKFDEDNIMVKNQPQEVTGLKIIHSTSRHPVVFKGIKLKGLLNGVDITDLINNQAYRNQNNVFKTSMNLFNNIATNNLVVKKHYKGVNMTELIENITNLNVLNNLTVQYENLLRMSQKLQQSIIGQAYFLHDYKIIQTIPRAESSKLILCPDGITRLGVITRDVSRTRIDLFGWESENGEFLLNATIPFNDHPVYIDQVLMGRYLYTEANNGVGYFIEMSKSLDRTVSILTNVTLYTMSFVLPTNEPCTLFIYHKDFPKIYCETDGEIRLKQILKSQNAYMATSLIIDDTLYLIIVTHPTQEVESHADLYKLKEIYFVHHQSMFVAHPKSITSISYKNRNYLAIASGHLQNAMYSGKAEIFYFDQQNQGFVLWQTLDLDAPIQIEFSILPSNELVLYILTDSPTEPLMVYRYEGIAGFRLKIAGSALPRSLYLNQFMGGVGQHFILTQSYDEINVIQAVFKGEKVADG